MSREKRKRPTIPQRAQTGRVGYPADEGGHPKFIESHVADSLLEVKKRTANGRRLNGLRPIPGQIRALVREHTGRIERKLQAIRRALDTK